MLGDPLVLGTADPELDEPELELDELELEDPDELEELEELAGSLVLPRGTA